MGREGQEIPTWPSWTGDPDFDNYAHVPPGKKSRRRYSSGGHWRLYQALTALWDCPLKDVLDEKIMSKIGIDKDEWELLPGHVVHDSHGIYGSSPFYGEFTS